MLKRDKTVRKSPNNRVYDLDIWLWQLASSSLARASIELSKQSIVVMVYSITMLLYTTTEWYKEPADAACTQKVLELLKNWPIKSVRYWKLNELINCNANKLNISVYLCVIIYGGMALNGRMIPASNDLL